MARARCVPHAKTAEHALLLVFLRLQCSERDGIQTERRHRANVDIRCSMKLGLFVVMLAALVACSHDRAGGLPQPSETNTHLDPGNVPSDLRDLIPLAEKWGIGDDIDRANIQSKASDQEKAQLVEALRGRNARITEWLDSYSGGAAMPREAGAFMYMQLGLDEMGLWQQ
jgi:hypothetical protein